MKQVADTPERAPVYAHGSFICLVGRDGLVTSIPPPTRPPERLAALMRKHFLESALQSATRRETAKCSVPVHSGNA